MKTQHKLVLMIILLSSISVKSQTDIITDFSLNQLILSTYPTIDTNQDGILTSAEATSFSFPNNTLELRFTDAQNAGIDFTGVEVFNISKLKLISDRSNGGLVQGFNLDLSKIGGTSCAPCAELDEIYFERMYFQTLDFANSRNITNWIFKDCTYQMNLEDLHLLENSSTSLTYLEIVNSGIFATLNLGQRGFLETVILRNLYLEGFTIEGNGLKHLTIENAQEFKTLSLPNTTTNDLSFLETLIIKGITTPVKLNSLDITKQKKLAYFYLETNAPNTGISAIDFSQNTLLTDFTLSNFDGISVVDISNNTLLTSVNINNLDAIGSLDVAKNTELATLKCSANKLNSIDITKNTKLEFFESYNNLLSMIDLSKNTELKEVELSKNNLTTLDVALNTKLEKLTANSNQLRTLDISSNGSLKWLECRENSLLSLNVANGINSTMNQWDVSGVMCTENPSLTCIYVDANVVNNIPQTWMKDATANYTLDDEISFASTNFRDALLTNPDIIDIDGNGKISTCEAENFTGTISVANQSIASVSGIEKFVNATGLDCSNNSLTALDLSINTKLKILNFSNNSIISIDISNLIQIETFDGSNNNLTALILGNNKTTLKDFNFSHNQLSGSYSTDGLSNLETFICNNNQLEHIGVTLNTKLKTLYCQNNPFSSAGAIDNIIDLSNNVDLEQLNCSNNQLEDLDVSNNNKLVDLKCNGNQLKKLNIANGNNANLELEASGNSTLYCIQVDAAIINTIPTTWIVDAVANYSVDACVIAECAEVTIPDANFKAALLNHTPRIDLDFDGKIEECEIDNYTGGIVDVRNKSITDFTGLEKFINVPVFDLSDNPTTSIDFSLLGEITELTIRNTQITSLDLSNNTKLIAVFGADNSKIISVNIKNGNNNAINDLEFHNCPLLNYICVDDVNYANTQSSPNNARWTKDATATYTSNCSLSVKDNVLKSSITFYPNPVNDVLHISNQSNERIKKVFIYTLVGKKVRESTTNSVQFSDLNRGLYIVKIVTDSNKILIQKIMKK